MAFTDKFSVCVPKQFSRYLLSLPAENLAKSYTVFRVFRCHTISLIAMITDSCIVLLVHFLIFLPLKSISTGLSISLYVSLLVFLSLPDSVPISVVSVVCLDPPLKLTHDLFTSNFDQFWTVNVKSSLEQY